MRSFLVLFFLMSALVSSLSFGYDTNSTPKAESKLTPEQCVQQFAQNVDYKTLETLPVQNQGRLKPFYTFTRESLLFLTGKYSPYKTNAIQFYLSLIVCEQTPGLKLINIREPELRTQLGLRKEERLFSVKELDATPLAQLAQPIAEKEEKNSRSLEPEEKNLLEVYSQYWFAKRIHSGNHFLDAINLEKLAQGNQKSDNPHPNVEVLQAAKIYLTNLSLQNNKELKKNLHDLMIMARSQKVPGLFEGQKDKFGIEIFFYKSKMFFIAGLLYLLIGVLFFTKWSQKILDNKVLSGLFLGVPLFLLLLGFGIRVYVTGFAPVTNMYGTMIWVAFGISLFSLMLYYLYKNTTLIGTMFLASSFFLILTESIPLILSPNMDPLVAVLRSNLWLTIHVLTIVISYAAFSISMVLGNYIMVRSMINGQYRDQLVKDFGLAIYRCNQLGVFLLTIGIILGGVWADYSWGRFWGWDPKETWALIADVGFLAILHGRFAGWITPYGMAVSSALAYLLVIFAWYGVNFLLATGLHSYGFSSGGATIVVSFVAIQVVLIGAAMLVKYLRGASQKSV